MNPIKPKDLKIRASQLSKVVTLDRATQLTANQAKEVQTLLEKEKLTEKQEETLKKLIAKRDAPDQLSKGGKTYIQELFDEHISGTRRVFTSRFTDKGNEVENKVIAEVCKYLKLPIVVKNEQYYNNEWTIGTPDTKFIPLNFQMDVKSVYYPHSLDHHDKKLDKEYEWQQHCYNWMLGVDNALVAKFLVNPPEHILEKEVNIMAKKAGLHYTEITDDFREEVRDYFDFESRMSVDDRINIYTVQTTDEHIEQMKKAVNLSRDYYAELCEHWKVKNTKEIEFVKQLLKR